MNSKEAITDAKSKSKVTFSHRVVCSVYNNAVQCNQSTDFVEISVLRELQEFQIIHLSFYDGTTRKVARGHNIYFSAPLLKTNLQIVVNILKFSFR